MRAFAQQHRFGGHAAMKHHLVLLCAALLLGAGCAAPCDANTCSGCCTANGCQPGGSISACGLGGNACEPCGGGQICAANQCVFPACVPTTCQALGKDCGEVDDGCGGVLSCGTCTASGTCGGAGVANVCGPGTCAPQTCMGIGAQCGRSSDGCAAVLDCGSCPGGTFCSGSPRTCGSCMPTTCQAAGKNCGNVPDGCGGTSSCGACSGTDTCGGAGVANVCGTGACTPTTCLALGKNCGAVNDGCGNMLPCGTCQAPTSCGGAGVANVCGAQCLAGCPSGFTCNAVGVCFGGDLTTLVLNEIGVPVAGSLRINGAAPSFSNPSYCADPGNAQDAIATVRFIDETRGYNAVTFVRCGSNFGFSTLLPPGTYEVRVESATYSASAGINLLPLSYLVNPALLVTAATTNLVLNEVGYSVEGTLKVNGAAPTFSNPSYCADPSSAQDAIAAVRFIDAAKGYNAVTFVRCGSGFTFGTLLPPGTYVVRVETATYSASAGINLLPVSYRANPALVVTGAVLDLALNEVGYGISGTLKVNGAAPTFANPSHCADPSSAEDAIAAVRFIDTAQGYNAVTFVRCASNFGFSTLLPPGTYDVRVETSTYSASAGINLLPVSYQVNPALVVSAQASNLVFNEVGYSIEGSLRVNGAAPTFTVPEYCADSSSAQDAIAAVRFIDKARGYNAVTFVTCASNFTFATQLPPGTYEVRVERSTYSASAGINLLPVSYLANPGLVVTGAVLDLLLDEVGVAVAGSVKVNGAAPTFATPGYCADPGNAQDAIAAVRFIDAARGYNAVVQVRCASNFAFSTLLPPGTYEVRVETATYSASAGINLMPLSYLANRALVVNAAATNLVLDEVGFLVLGRVQVNGAPPVASNPSYCADPGNAQDSIAAVRFIDATQGYNAVTFVRCGSGFQFNTLLPTGSYEVRVESATYTASAGLNLLPVSYQAITRLAVP